MIVRDHTDPWGFPAGAVFHPETHTSRSHQPLQLCQAILQLPVDLLSTESSLPPWHGLTRCLCHHPYSRMVLKRWEDGCRGHVLLSQCFPGQTARPISSETWSAKTPSPAQLVRSGQLRASSRSQLFHVWSHNAFKSLKFTPMDQVENECHRGAGNNWRKHSKAGTSGPAGCRPESQPKLQRMVCDHLPEAPAYRGLQGAQAAQGDPEEKARQCQCQGAVENRFKHSFNKPVQSLLG